MFSSSSDSEWLKWKESDLYYAVLTDDRYRGKQELNDFFYAGEKHFNRILNRLDSLSLKANCQGTALDYGCGTGRVLKYMAEYFDKSVGIDVNPNMIEETKINVDMKRSVLLVLRNSIAVGDLIRDYRFDFIHSTLVFQHIKQYVGMTILKEILSQLNSKGIAVIQLPILSNKKVRYYINNIRCIHPILFKISGLFKCKLLKDPIMQMNVYDSAELINLFRILNIEVRSVDTWLDENEGILHAEFYLYKN